MIQTFYQEINVLIIVKNLKSVIENTLRNFEIILILDFCFDKKSKNGVLFRRFGSILKILTVWFACFLQEIITRNDIWCFMICG